MTVWLLEKPTDTWRVKTRKTTQTTIQFGEKLEDDPSVDTNGNYKNLNLTNEENRLWYEVKNPVPPYTYTD